MRSAKDGFLDTRHLRHHAICRGFANQQTVLRKGLWSALVFEDMHSAVFKFGETLINLLHISQADELVAPATVASRGAGVRHVFTIAVDDVDSMCAELTQRGVVLLNGPMDRPWGIRTAASRSRRPHLGDRKVDVHADVENKG